MIDEQFLPRPICPLSENNVRPGRFAAVLHHLLQPSEQGEKTNPRYLFRSVLSNKMPLATCNFLHLNLT